MPKEPHAKPSKVAKKKKIRPGDPIPPPPDKPGQCHFWIPYKGKYCSLLAKKTNKYCGEHLSHDLDSTSNRRIPCPYDPSHTVYEKVLEEHLKSRCNARPRAPEQYHALNVNCSLPLSTEELEFQKTIYSHKNMHPQPWLVRVQLSELAKEDLDTIIDKTQKTYHQELPSPIQTMVLKNDTAESKREQVKRTKHLDQQSSLLGHMERCGMLDDKSACFIEFGAGKGETSHYLKNALGEVNGEATYVLVDRKLVRNKVDNALLGHSEKKSTVQRITIDIKDLELSRVQALSDDKGQRKPVVAFSKHLCGSATDITLKCLMNYVEKERANGNKTPISGIIIALCCHQLCRYEMYPNTPYLTTSGFEKIDFARLCKMSSWAICGLPDKNGENSTQDGGDDHACIAGEEGDADASTNHYSGRDHQEREDIGFQCKRVIDIGRVRYLEEHGFKAELVYYVDRSTSLENCALIAVPDTQ
ncbi:hypothetical protein O0I10_000780 [Lichtheimia ornata]|uniref:tRNA:m(4)X modification enzyme TRM13 n=1 Tax=Lichtheimia ornata TaxID=688661 RepID=A0AAD7Y4C8_9FUNG|nr:uncharacterized protein O0I10_000780 [Lichtheimia ornata]KAJ8663537.1 hypothetical protein O0I10_000780 [Lichtheimia ornata]